MGDCGKDHIDWENFPSVPPRAALIIAINGVLVPGIAPVSRDNYGPFQVLPKFAGDDAPLIERARRSRSDLNERPVSNQRKRDFAVRQWAVNNEMVVAMYQNPYHVKVTLPYADREPGDRSQNGTPLVPALALGPGSGAPLHRRKPLCLSPLNRELPQQDRACGR